MAQKFIRLIPTTLMMIMVACSPSGNVISVVSPTPSFTPVVATATMTEMSTPTTTQAPQGFLKEQCTEILPAFPEGAVPTGTLVIYPPGGLSLLNFNRQTQRTIPGHFYSVGASPNGKWLSYIIFTPTDDGKDVTMDLVVESVDGQNQSKLPFEVESGWDIYGLIPWLDNERLWFLIWDRINAPQTLVLNPFTGERQVLLPDYPNFNRSFYGPVDSPPLFFGSSNVAYGPSLRFVVYPLAADDGLYDALWDREARQTLARLRTGGIYVPLPLWLPDGRAFVVAAFPDEDSPLREWFLVSVDGEIHQLTHFGDHDSQYEFGYDARLSPDGRYLAFGLVDGNSPYIGSAELVILDLHTLEAINTCIAFYNYSSLVWSPDSQYLAVRHWDDDKQVNSVVVLDPEHLWAVTVFTDNNETPYRTSPKAWLDSGK